MVATAGAGETPRFSVVLISYQQRAYVEAAVRSVLDGGFDRLELVCVDDGSTDGTAELLDRLATTDARMRVLHREHRGRPAASRNAGLAVARGDYVCFLDGDDLYHPRRLALLDAASACMPDGVDVLFHDYLDFPDGQQPAAGPGHIESSAVEPRLHALALGAHTLPGGIDAYPVDGTRLATLLVSDSFIVNTGTVCIRREHFLRHAGAFPEDRVVGEDNICWLRCIVAGRAIYVDAVLSYWRKYPGSLTSRRSSSKQRELVRSIHEYIAVVDRDLSGADRAAARRRMMAETVEIGWQEELEGAWLSAARTYVGAAVAFRTHRPLLRAAKALVRPVLGRRPRPAS